ncbi:MAG: glycosyltransferase family 4 protein [Oxalicibacterium faecigallinarum]|uniref:glycosyltransferase family 4 protein n=1 Tax=Oxalicibacterium faecigallinarum TaxID=573741 RepID=UPI0028091A86|nr:glycosyltransferase family 4 protein [Oxalicibacterium faecigallinarum]MDQ7969248.1 glycosyltransferase family 4 protein [Oxalicibacterium faecigallinarum]
MPINVVHLVRQYHPSIGGMEDVVQNIVRYQRDAHGHQPTIVTLNRLFRNTDVALPERDEVDGVPVIRLPFRGSTRYPLAPQVLQHVRQADVVHVHGVDFFYDYLALTKPLHKRPLVASTHGGFFHTEFASRLKRVYFNTVTRSTSLAYDRIVGTSNNDGDLFGEIVSAPRLSVIENGVNVDKFADCGSRTRVPVLIYFGRWSVNKGLLETIALFRHLVAQRPEWRLIIAGREYDHTQAELSDLLAQQGLSEKVTLVESPDQTALSALIGHAGYYICLSRHEGFGIAPIEGMSAGLTPILSDIPPFRHLVEKSGLGLILDRRDIAANAARIAALHDQGDEAFAARREAAQAFVQQYSWRHIADRYVDIYRDLAHA